ncbi:hypothetical protein HYX14_04050 [Candidatus Woesearchaeota archaeon]|nr:hypothetical protein [Candidatus Woesearchaeota archaeon]
MGLEVIVEQDVQDIPFVSQSGSGRCGPAAVNNVLKVQFNLDVTEENVLAVICTFYGEHYQADGREVFDNRGTSPTAMAYALRHFIPGIHIFCSNHGTASRLRELQKKDILPIIHQRISYQPDEKPEGHYMLFAGATESDVTFFDPSRDEGLKELSVRQFHRQWYDRGMRWYLVALPEYIAGWKGRYL